MSLLDDAIMDQTNRATGMAECKMAQFLIATYSKRMNEVVDLMRSDKIRNGIKYDTLELKGALTSGTFSNKMRDGCNCQWCKDTWMEA